MTRNFMHICNMDILIFIQKHFKKCSPFSHPKSAKNFIHILAKIQASRKEVLGSVKVKVNHSLLQQKQQ